MVQLFAPQRVLALSWYGCKSSRRREELGRDPTLKLRLDKLLVDRGFAASRERAQALIIAGKVLVNDQKLDKAGAHVVADSAI
jgi:ribosomal protein S4